MLSSIDASEEKSDKPTGLSQPRFEIPEHVVQVQLDGLDAGLRLESNSFEILNLDASGKADDLHLVTEWKITRDKLAAPDGWSNKNAPTPPDEFASSYFQYSFGSENYYHISCYVLLTQYYREGKYNYK